MEKPQSLQSVFDDACRSLLVKARDHDCADSLNLLAATLADTTLRIAEKVVRRGNRSRSLIARDALAWVFAPYVVGENDPEKTEERRPRILQFDPDRFEYERWCYRVLHNWSVSQYRKLNIELTVDTFHLTAAYEPDDLLLLGKPFGGKDLAVIQAWPAIDRLMLLCLSGLFVKLERTDWQKFTSEAEAEIGFLLPAPLPMEQLLEVEDPSARIALVAELLRVTKNTLSSRWMRKKHLLRKLSVVRDCQPENELDHEAEYQS